MKITPYIQFHGNAEEAMNFYAIALGGNISELKRYGEGSMPADEDYKDKVLHGRLMVGANIIMISDTTRVNEVSTAGNIQLAVEITEAGQIDVVFNKMAEGGNVTMPLQDTFWGARFGMLKDKFGVNWMFNYEMKK